MKKLYIYEINDGRGPRGEEAIVVDVPDGAAYYQSYFTGRTGVPLGPYSGYNPLTIILNPPPKAKVVKWIWERPYTMPPYDSFTVRTNKPLSEAPDDYKGWYKVPDTEITVEE